MGKKTHDLGALLNPPPSEADLARLQATVDSVAKVNIPLGDTPEPPEIGDIVLVKDVDASGAVYPAMVISADEDGKMTLEVHAFNRINNRKLPNGQTVTFSVPMPHTFIIETDETGNLDKPAMWFPRT